MMVEDKSGRGLPALDAATQEIVAKANQTPGLAGVFSLFNTRTPKLYADIDRVKAEMLGVPADRVFETLEVYLGSTYVNDFNYLGRTFRLTAQADGKFRQNLRDIGNYKTRSDSGGMVPLSAVASFHDRTGAYRVPRFNLYPAAEVQGATLPGYSTGYALATMEQIAAETLPQGFGFEWTELALQEKLAGNTGMLVFVASVVFVFLLLAAQYESWTLPLSVILIVPMCLLAAVTGLLLRGMDVNILAQIGFVVLIGLAAKNAILIAEFAMQGMEAGKRAADAARDAARLRFRPIVMTSLAFVFGALVAVFVRGFSNDVYFQIGLVVLIGLAAKNAILIVEFAAQEQAKGLKPLEAALEAARLRFRPIVMTSLAFVLGVLPLVLAGGAGAGARRSMGTGVFGGMIAATFIATLFIPLFFVILSNVRIRRARASPIGKEETA